MHKPEFVSENVTHRFLWALRHKQITKCWSEDQMFINKKEGACHQLDFSIAVGSRVKGKKKKKKKIVKYPDIARERKKLLNIKVTMVRIVIGINRTVLKGLEKRLAELEISRRIEKLLTTALFKSARIFRRVMDTERTCYQSLTKQKNKKQENKNKKTNS